MKRVVVGMSGGVDSSVAALLMRDQGHEVVGVTMSIYSGKPADGPVPDSCYGPGEPHDIAQAAEICGRLGIPHHVIDLRGEYRSLVLDYAREEYLDGRTPNPCVLCNQKVKFGMLLDRLDQSPGLGFDLFVTGHYARTAFMQDTGRRAIRTAADPAKDQSYFLCMLSQDRLARVAFPLGEMSKPRVREIARAAGLVNHDRPESQDFAFGGYKAVVNAPDRPGPITDLAGAVIGRHRGIWAYTIGQRRGLGVGGGEPLYVTGLDARTNTVVAGPESALYRRELTVRGLNWMSIEPPPPGIEPLRLQAKIRYRNAAMPASVTAGPDGTARVVFDEPQRAIARGQWAVLYDGDIVVGGGVISD
ncbi:MAG TPA: tRNA 2-thiouridine(34) synthase MnmA [Spirochaetia bacterium]|nr:tRNA 2-thiouridine(34) synthase MnmA [Spirochaetia bacterium]